MYPEYGRVYPPANSTFKSVRGGSSGICKRDLYKSSKIVVMDETLSITACFSTNYGNVGLIGLAYTRVR